MKIAIHYRGQLSTEAGIDREECEIEPGTTLASLIANVVEGKKGRFREIIFGDDGDLRRTLLVAVNGQQVLEMETSLGPETEEVTLIPPIAGG